MCFTGQTTLQCWIRLSTHFPNTSPDQGHYRWKYVAMFIGINSLWSLSPSAGVSGSSTLHYILQSLYSFLAGFAFHSFSRQSIRRTPFSCPMLFPHPTILADCPAPYFRGSRGDQACTTGRNLPLQGKSLPPELFKPSPPRFLSDCVKSKSTRWHPR